MNISLGPAKMANIGGDLCPVVDNDELVMVTKYKFPGKIYLSVLN